jgi:receptor protein-tyrosine kinase
MLIRAGLRPPQEAAFLMAEEFKRIRRPLLAQAFGELGIRSLRSNAVMIVSADPGTGKSFVAFNLALSLAGDIDHSVLLVDGDVARRKITIGLGLEDNSGLIDLLADRAIDDAEAIVQTDVGRLSFLPAGRDRAGATELLASNRMRDLVRRLTAVPGRIVVFDSPPVLITNEAQVLATHMGQFVVVVEFGKTSRRAVRSVIEMLDESKPISLLLNKATPLLGNSEYHGYDYRSSY